MGGDGRRIVIVGDDEWVRRGIADGIREMGGLLQVHAALSIDRAVSEADWQSVDLALVRISLAAEDWDRYRNLRVFGDIKSTGHSPVTVAVVDDVDADLIVLRAVEVGAQYLYTAAEVADLDALENVLLVPSPDRATAERLDHATLRSLGLTTSSRPGAGLAFIQDRDLAGAFDGAVALTRRRSITVREQLASIIRVRPVVVGSAGLDSRKLPSWKQLRQIVSLARGGPSATD